MSKNKFHLSSIPAFVYLALIIPLLLSACSSGSNNQEENAAYVTFSIPKPGGNGRVTAQQLENVTSIIITVTDDRGNSVSGDIWKTGGKLTLIVKPHVVLTISGVAYEGSIATYSDETTAGPLRPGEVASISFSLKPINPQPKPDPVVTPGNGASGIAIDTNFVVDLSVLSDEIDQLTGASLALTDGSSPAINTNYLEPEAGLELNFFLPDDVLLSHGTLYTASLQVSYIDFNGTTQSYDYSWSFTTVQVLPDPVVTPANGSIGVAVDTEFFVNLDAWEVIDHLSGASLTLSDNNSPAINTVYSAPEEGFVLRFSLPAGTVLNPGTLYTASLQVNYVDVIGAAQSYDYAWSFTTAELINLENITDNDLAACIEADMTEFNFQYVTDFVNFSCTYRYISTLDGLEALINLETLDLQGNSISDISPLQYLTKLRTLNLSNCRNCDINGANSNFIEDFSPLYNLENLEELDISDMGPNDYSQLGQLTNLVILDVALNGIENINFVYDLINLQYLNLRSNLINALDWQQNSPQLTILHLENNSISSLQGLQNLPQLAELYLNRNSLTDLNGMNDLPNLTTLDLQSNNLASLNGMMNLPILTDLNVYNNSISSIAGLQNFPQLTTLNAQSNNIMDIQELSSIDSLVYINLSWNKIRSIDLANMPALDTLDIQRNSIQSAQFSGSFDNLTQLYISNNYLVDTGFAANLPALQYLGLSWNLVEDVSPLANLNTISRLDLSANNVMNGVDLLTGFSNASYIWLSNNPAMPCGSVEALDNALDDPMGTGTGDGGNVGIVRWSSCFTESTIASLTFADANLEACVDSQATIQEIINVSELTILDCSSQNITNLSGIQQLPFLTELYLSNNPITNFLTTEYLRNLKTLDLSNTTLSNSNRYFLSDLKNLENLYLDSNPFNYVSNLSGLINIVTLSLVSNQILPTTGQLLDLENLFNARTIDLSCSPTDLEADIIALDAAIGTGIVIMGCG
jgi:Leucine-rich repeat (LRR) protein